MTWSTVELREIRVFLALAEELHFGRAGERLQLSPSRISQILRDLERKTGNQLVHRTSRRVELTAYGERFRREAGDAYQNLADTLLRLSSDNDTQSLRLGLFSDPGVSQIPQIVRAFERRFPARYVEAVEVPIDEPFGPLHRGELDAIASWLPHGQSRLVVGPILSREPRILAVATDHPLAARTAISIEDAADYQVVRFDTMPKEFHDVWIPARTPSGRPIRSRRFSDQSIGDRGRMTSELLYLIATGRVVHPTVPSFANMFGHPDIVYISITDLPPLRSALVWRRENTNSVLRDFADIAREVVRKSR
ncbi:LysR family transcriptional regulator [Kribbella capetownensis]|uniref:LysR family transcriptional regulator n=1 Tax=Kribbella capetownensis TaxID=1572659 RepID=A0A4R0JF54_9ACTN|nr:LysR family transcriptional regulator [Kribbella capetownensis]TCC44204.1 LysR family transcriptional regulator [Kribbella capetownensis]